MNAVPLDTLAVFPAKSIFTHASKLRVSSDSIIAFTTLATTRFKREICLVGLSSAIHIIASHQHALLLVLVVPMLWI